MGKVSNLHSIKRGATEIVLKSTGELIPYINNSRTHTEQQVAQVAASIKEFGFTNPILIDEDGGIIAGHGRLMAAQLLELEYVPCIPLLGLTEAQKKAYVIADNQLALSGDWNIDKLRLEVETLTELDFNIGILGFNDTFLENLSGDHIDDTLGEWDGMPEFDQNDASSYKKCIVHFANEDDRQEFFSLIGQSNTDRTNSIWHPEQIRMDTEARRYEDG